MVHYLIELAVYMIIAYLLGCLLGAAFRKFFGVEEEVAAVVAPVAAVAAVAAAPQPVRYTPPPAPVAPIPAVVAPKPVVVAPKPAPVAAPAAPLAAVGKLQRPTGLTKARGGKADDLQRISGVGPKNESILHKLGVFHFDQIANWTSEQVSWVDDHLKFNGRIKREEWIRQCRLLSDGNEKEFKRLYGTGGLRGKSGQSESGTRTRKP
jgi:predicted flap endonuclease-1-like 5' DNA nuclease